jgi:hypothetical protein
MQAPNKNIRILGMVHITWQIKATATVAEFCAIITPVLVFASCSITALDKTIFCCSLFYRTGRHATGT